MTGEADHSDAPLPPASSGRKTKWPRVRVDDSDHQQNLSDGTAASARRPGIVSLLRRLVALAISQMEI